MVKVFILVLWATGAGAELGPEPYSTLQECVAHGERFFHEPDSGYESFACAELEITNPE